MEGRDLHEGGGASSVVWSDRGCFEFEGFDMMTLRADRYASANGHVDGICTDDRFTDRKRTE